MLASVLVVALGLTGLAVVTEQANRIDDNTVTASFIVLVCIGQTRCIWLIDRLVWIVFMPLNG